MAPMISENEFNAELDKRGFRIMRPGDDGVTVWGYVDIGGGVLVNRWSGGATLSSQLDYLIRRKSEVCSGPPPAAPHGERSVKKTTETKKKGKKSNG